MAAAMMFLDTMLPLGVIEYLEAKTRTAQRPGEIRLQALWVLQLLDKAGIKLPATGEEFNMRAFNAHTVLESLTYTTASTQLTNELTDMLLYFKERAQAGHHKDLLVQLQVLGRLFGRPPPARSPRA